MKRVLLMALALAVTLSFGLAYTAMADEGAAKGTTMTGYVIDTKCATANKDTLGDFVKTHSKDCAIACHDTGYNIFSEGKLYALDKASSDKAYDFLMKPDSKTNVKVELVVNGDTAILVSIVNAS